MILNNFKKGFTVVELMVVTAIFALMSSIAIANYPSFTTRLSLELLAHDIALTIRQSQVYTLGVKALAGNFPSWGVHFEASDAKHFILFADKNGNAVYDKGDDCGGADTECQTKYTVQGLNEITQLCGKYGISYVVKHCTDSGALIISYLDVVFRRPDPDALSSSNQYAPPKKYSDAYIKVLGVEGRYSYIYVT
ncbi:MAG: prepilin-type N-terminal cleavage/methylation domain-containing protein, partial [Patescibacteria group bacterium]